MSLEKRRVAAAGEMHADAGDKHEGGDRKNHCLRQSGVGVEQHKMALHEADAALHDHDRAEQKKGHHHQDSEFGRHGTPPVVCEGLQGKSCTWKSCTGELRGKGGWTVSFPEDRQAFRA